MIARFFLPLILGILGLQTTETVFTKTKKYDSTYYKILQKKQSQYDYKNNNQNHTVTQSSNSNPFSFILRAIGCVVTLCIILPVIIWYTFTAGIVLFSTDPSAGSGAVYFLIGCFPLFLGISLLTFTNPVMRLFKFEPFFEL